MKSILQRVSNDEASHLPAESLRQKLAVYGARVINIEVRNFSLSQNKDVPELRRIEVERTKAEKWNGQLPQNMYAGAPVPFMQVH